MSADPSQPSTRPPKVAVISRQRLIGATNGSSAYLLDIVEALSAAGAQVQLIQPSPGVLGRWPVMKLRPAMDVFGAIHIRGVARIGRLVLALDPGVYLAATQAVLAQVLGRLKLPSAWLGARKAPYAVAAPWTAADHAFVARHVEPSVDRVLADYMFQTEGFADVPRGAPTAVVMHDLFHARTATFAATGAADSVALVDEPTEAALLDRASLVIAIQAAEADWVRGALPGKPVIVAPIAAHPVAQAQPGEDDLVLFVGSNTAPNVQGLEYLFAEVWPAVRAQRPACRLLVAGSVARAFNAAPPEGVRFLGMVESLDELYRQAGVVISPLQTGSGLKIKLIEAMAKGKAIVASPITLQGVEEVAGPTVRVGASAAEFSSLLIDLVADSAERRVLGEAALGVARQNFSVYACYSELVDWLGQGR